MHLSFIIPLKDDPVIARLLFSISKQNCSRFEVIVIDSSTDRSYLRKQISKYTGTLDMVVVHVSCGIGTARNIGARLARTEILAFTDSDVVLRTDFVEKVIRAFEKHDDLVALCFPVYPTKKNKLTISVYNNPNRLNRFFLRYGKPRIPTTCAVYHRSVFQNRCFLDLVGEDILFSADVQSYGRALFAEHIPVFEEPRRWMNSSATIKSILHYVPSYIISFLVLIGFHGLLVRLNVLVVLSASTDIAFRKWGKDDIDR
ncbi:MAG: glycosyltransferase family 2 protein [Candidatus Bathyarchaeia archaeon]